MRNLAVEDRRPGLARFLVPDALRGDPRRPQTFNLFAYVTGNPSTYTDPWGFSSDQPDPQQCPPDIPGPCYGISVTGPYWPIGTIPVPVEAWWFYYFPVTPGAQPGRDGDQYLAGGDPRMLARRESPVPAIDPPQLAPPPGTPCMPRYERSVAKGIELWAAAEMIETGVIVATTGLYMMSAGVMTSGTGIGPVTGFGVGIPLLGIGGFVGYHGFLTALDATDRKDLGRFPPPCPD
ncbi:MAG: hypothetical protein AB1625_05860 [Acidobacteriota bacterium]